MWKLICQKEGKHYNSAYNVLIDEELAVGRKDCNILIPGDPSVSRRHALINASHPIGNIRNVDKKPILVLKDSASKYGSFVNGKQVSNEGAILKHNDVITFGQCGSNFQVLYKPLVVTTSCVDPNDKNGVKEDIRKLGGHVIEEWTTACTHLAMTAIKVTVKTVCALVSAKPIVRPEYFKMYREHCNTNREPEDFEKFLPPVSEIFLDQTAISFQIKPDRQQIFKNKNFIFLSTKQYMKLRLPVYLGAGKPILIHHSECDITTELLLSSCVVQCTVDGTSTVRESTSEVCNQKKIEEISTLLTENKKHLIPESDIGLAVVHCSTEIYCNPNTEVNKSTSSTENVKLQSQTLSQSFMHNFISDTANSATSHSLSFSNTTWKSQIVATIPETAPGTNKSTANLKITPSKKRPLESSESKAEEPVPKIPKSNQEPEIVQIKEEPSSLPLTFDPPSNRNETNNRSSVNLLENTQHFSASLFRDETQEYVPKGQSRKTVHKETLRESESSKKQKYDPVSETMLKDETQEYIPREQRNKTAHNETLNESETTKKKTPEDMETNDPIEDNIPKSPLNIRKPQRVVDVQLHVPPGFLHSKIPPKIKTTCKEEPDTAEKIDFPSNLLVVKLADLMIKDVNRRKNKTSAVIANEPSLKNFKRFKKTAHAGFNHLPHIIGGNDLLVFQRREAISEINEWLVDEQTEENSDADLQDNTSFNAPIRKLKRR